VDPVIGSLLVAAVESIEVVDRIGVEIVMGTVAAAVVESSHTAIVKAGVRNGAGSAEDSLHHRSLGCSYRSLRLLLRCCFAEVVGRRDMELGFAFRFHLWVGIVE